MRGKNWIILILLLGGGLRTAIIASDLQTNSDGVIYAWIGSNIADGKGYTIAEGTSLSDSRQWHVPAYPLILGMTYKLIGKGLFNSKIPSLLFGTALILVVYLLTLRIFDHDTALIASFFISLHPLLSAFSAEVMAESMYLLLLYTFLYILLNQSNINLNRKFLVLGVIGGLLYLTRTVGIVSLFLISCYYLLSKKEINRRQIIEFPLGYLITALPWWVYSKTRYGTPFAAEQNTLIQMYMYEFGDFHGKSLNLVSYLFREHDLTGLITGHVDGVYKLLKSAIFPQILFFRERSAISMTTLVVFLIVAILLLIGVMRALKELDRIPLAVLSLTLILTLLTPAWGVHIIPFQNATIFRYTLPFTPLLIILLSAGIARIYHLKGLRSILAILSIILIDLSCLSILYGNHHLQTQSELGFYRLGLKSIPSSTPILASDVEMLEGLGFNNVHPIDKRDFTELEKKITQLEPEYLVMDTHSLYNDDQFYLLNYWYRDRIPSYMDKVDGDLFPIAVYQIKK